MRRKRRKTADPTPQSHPHAATAHQGTPPTSAAPPAEEECPPPQAGPDSLPDQAAGEQNEAPAEEQVQTDFQRDLIARGEAVATPEGEPLPPGATHRIVQEGDEPPSVKRERFSAY